MENPEPQNDKPDDITVEKTFMQKNKSIIINAICILIILTIFYYSYNCFCNNQKETYINTRPKTDLSSDKSFDAPSDKSFDVHEEVEKLENLQEKYLKKLNDDRYD